MARSTPPPVSLVDRPRTARTRERYLSIPEAAERLGTTDRFPRRLVEERRIEFKRFGRHIRIAESVLDAYIESCTVAPRQRPLMLPRRALPRRAA